ncbi:RHS repeat protein [Flavobacterium sp. LaA7.5]|nr:RHS repeat protein [Flavobacterium salilacus subsp. altitudinum]
MSLKLVICVVFLIYLPAMAQFKAPPLDNINIQSPNSASLGKFGDTPVSLYTGTPNISVPLYSLEERGVKLDISLQYDATGVRVNDVPGWVGQNWALNAGGAITRTVKGLAPDELNFFLPGWQLNSPLVGWGSPILHGGILGGEDPLIGSAYPGGHYRQTYQRGYFYNKQLLNTTSWSSSSTINDLVCRMGPGYHNTFGLNPESSDRDWMMDLEPDVFTFNFMGHTGKFFLGQDGQWKVMSDSNLKVEMDFTTDVGYPVPAYDLPDTNSLPYIQFPRVIQRITLIDSNGIKYKFGFTNNSRELSFANIFNQFPGYLPTCHGTRIISSAWYLTGVYDQFDNTLYEFIYERGPYIAHLYPTYNIKSALTDINNCTINPSRDFNQNEWHPTQWPRVMGQLILPCYLKTIRSNSGVTVDLSSSISQALKYKKTDNTLFPSPSGTYYGSQASNWYYQTVSTTDFITPVYNTPNQIIDILEELKWKKLDSITIKDNTSEQIQINFKFNNIATQRLFLEEVDINNQKKYKFMYHAVEDMPNFLSTAIDHFGYYDASKFLFYPLTDCQQSINFWQNDYYNERETSSDYIRYGTIDRVIYPTGGSSQYFFEPHSYSKEVDKNGSLITSPNNKIIGGLRIKKIIDRDLNGNETIKEYEYKNNLNSDISSGNLLFKPIYYENFSIEQGCPDGSTTTVNFAEASINPLISMSNFSGTTVEYESVFEKTNGQGYVQYKFSNYSQYPNVSTINPITSGYSAHITRTDRSFERGKLLEKKIYDNSNNLQKRVTLTYHSDNVLKVNGLNVIFFDYYNSAENLDAIINTNLAGAYQIYYSDKVLTQEKEEVYTNSGVYTSLKKYSYKCYPELPPPGSSSLQNFGDIFLSREYIQDSKSSYTNSGNLTTYSYPFDISSSVSTNMYNKRILPPMITKTEQILGEEINEPYEAELLFEEKIVYENFSHFNEDNNEVLIPVPKEIWYKKGNAISEKRFEYVDYDNIGNLLEYKLHNGSPIICVWGYNGTKLIAKIENASYSSLTTTQSSLINAAKNASSITILDKLTQLRNGFPLAMVTSFTYRPLVGVTSITDPRGYTTYYEYDNQSRLKYIKDKDGNILEEYEYNYKSDN